MTNNNTPDYNSIADYYRVISAVPRLSSTQERLLLQKIQEMRLEKENAFLEQRDPHSRVFQEGEQARDRFIQANLRLVVDIVNRRFSSRLQSMTKMDLIEAGNIGLIQAVDSFDLSRGNAFSTYATWVIKNAILAAIYKEDRVVRLPAYQEENIRQASIKGTMERLADITVTDVLSVLSINQLTSRPPEVIDAINSTIEGTLSEESFATSPIEEFITRQDLYELSRVLLERLTSHEREIAVALFIQGITDAEVARQLGVSRVRVGQRKKAIREKLKNELDRRHITLDDVFDLFD